MFLQLSRSDRRPFCTLGHSVHRPNAGAAPAKPRAGRAAVLGSRVRWIGRRLAFVALVVNPVGAPAAAQQTWTQMAPVPQVCGLSGRPAVWTGPPLNRLIIWGGVNASGLADQGCSYDLATNGWSVISKIGAPTPRSGHSGTWTGREVIFWGGATLDGILSTGSGGRYDPFTDTWAPVSKVDAPSGRQGHTAVWTGSRLIVWGGNVASGRDPAGGMYDPAANKWMPMSTVREPRRRTGHSSVWTGSRLLVWGGSEQNATANDGALYDPFSDSWSPMGGTPPSARTGHTTVWTGTRLIVWGGLDASSLRGLATGGSYDPGTDSWTPTTEVSAPTPRGEHTAVWTGSRMAVWGGRGSTAGLLNPPFGDGALFDPVQGSWSPIVSTAAPAPRMWHTAVWTGSTMLIMGGSDASFANLTDGGLWQALDPSGQTPAADFTFSPGSPLVGQTITFTDASGGAPTSWSWAFGDGGTSTAQHPTYTYRNAGPFAVRLTAANASGSSSRTNTVAVSVLSPPVITSFTASPTFVATGQQTTLSWASTGAMEASIDQGVGSVPTTGSRTITPVLDVPYRLTVTGIGGSTSATVVVRSVPSTYASTWLLPSSARVSGQNAFWTTDLVIANSGTEAAIVNLKFLGHEGNGTTGPESVVSIPAHATSSFTDVLSRVFGRTSDYGPILIRSTVPTLAAQGQTWTAAGMGGSYGQSVPALTTAEMVGAIPKAIAGVRQDGAFRTNLVLANPTDATATVAVKLLLADGTTATSRDVEIGPFGFSQLNVASHLGVANLIDGSFLVACPTPGCSIAAYASVIDAVTSDPRTILAR